MSRRLSDTPSVFEKEVSEQPRMLTLGLHPHLTGVPHRFFYLEAMLDLLISRGDTQFVTGQELAKWYEAVCPRPEK